MNKYLTAGPESVAFLDMAQLETGLNAILGDPSAVVPDVRPDVVRSRTALREATKKVAALVGDPTRNDVQKHAAAKKLADSVLDTLGKAQTAIVDRANTLRIDALEKADQALGPRSDRATLHSEIRGWVREVARTSDGLTAIREEMKANGDLADVLWHSPRFLVGLPESTFGALRFEALQAKRPDLYASLGTAMALDALAGKYTAVIRKLPVAFYNPELASAASRRVEV